MDAHNRAPGERIWTVNGGNCKHVQIYIGHPEEDLLRSFLRARGNGCTVYIYIYMCIREREREMERACTRGTHTFYTSCNY